MVQIIKKTFGERYAFTLAEILITLGIIGVVAAITIPILTNQYQNHTYITGLQKAYATLSQISQKIQADYGCSGNLACTGLFGAATDANSLGTEFVKYYKASKDCGITTNQFCWPDSVANHYDGSGNIINKNTDATHYKFMTNDGMSMAIVNYSTNCTTTSGTGPLASSVCAIFSIDVNGAKGPNRNGRDNFAFRLVNDGRVFMIGTEYDSYPYATNCNPAIAAGTSNSYCAGKIQAEGWQMNY